MCRLAGIGEERIFALELLTVVHNDDCCDMHGVFTQRAMRFCGGVLSHMQRFPKWQRPATTNPHRETVLKLLLVLGWQKVVGS